LQAFFIEWHAPIAIEDQNDRALREYRVLIARLIVSSSVSDFLQPVWFNQMPAESLDALKHLTESPADLSTLDSRLPIEPDFRGPMIVSMFHCHSTRQVYSLLDCHG
jgi:hypothetical protein